MAAFSGKSLVLLVVLAPSALAQHLDMLVWDDGGTIGVGEFNYDTWTASDRRVHLGRFNSFYSIDSPGFIAPLTGSQALPGEEQLSWNYLPMTVDSGPHSSYRSTILYWDGESATPEFGPAPTADYRFSIFGVYGSETAKGLSEMEPGSVIAPTPPNGYVHEHPYFLLDDNDGVDSTLPAAGIYLIAFEFEINGLEPSAPAFQVWATPEASVLPARKAAEAWVTDRIDSLVVEYLAGDFNFDGVVNLADYTVWRDGLGGDYDLNDYQVWRENFGAGLPASIATATVPEPDALSVALLAVATLLPLVLVSSTAGVARVSKQG